MAAMAVWALWTTVEHVGLMARPTTDDNIRTRYDDAVFCDSEMAEDVRAYLPGLTCTWNARFARSRHSVYSDIH